MSEVIYLKDAAKIINCRDIRTLKKWCTKKGVEIFSDESRRAYLMQIQFQYARFRKLIEYLKNRYGDKWFEAFKAYVNVNLFSLVEIEEGFKYKSPSKDNYKPVGEHEKLFLTRLSNLSPEL